MERKGKFYLYGTVRYRYGITGSTIVESVIWNYSVLFFLVLVPVLYVLVEIKR